MHSWGLQLNFQTRFSVPTWMKSSCRRTAEQPAKGQQPHPPCSAHSSRLRSICHFGHWQPGLQGSQVWHSICQAGQQESGNLCAAWWKLNWLNPKALGRESETTSCSPVHMEGANQFLRKGAESRNLARSATLRDSEGMMILTEGLELKAYS